MRVRVRVCVCVCVTMKKVPDEWQARQTIPAILQVSSSKHNAKKKNYNKSKRPVSSVDHCHPYRRKKRREAVFYTYTCCSLPVSGPRSRQESKDSKDDGGSQGQYREQRREVRGKMTLTVEYSEMTAKNVEHFK